VPSFTNELSRRSQQNMQQKKKKKKTKKGVLFLFLFFDLAGKVVGEWRQAVEDGGQQQMMVAAGGSECLVLELGWDWTAKRLKRTPNSGYRHKKERSKNHWKNSYRPHVCSFDTMLNHYLSQKLKLIGRCKFNHLINTLTVTKIKLVKTILVP
jgi:hypothetical protein